MVGYPFQYKSCTQILHDEYLAGGDDEDDDTETSHTVLAYSYELLAKDTHTHTQQIRLLPVWHNDYLLLIEWKWIIMKVFIPDTFLLSRLKRRRKRRG